MIIGVPTEVKTDEFRVGLRPVGAEMLVRDGHRVIVQSGAGLGSGFEDERYEAAGATYLGADTAAPYAFTWNGVADGCYAIAARAFDVYSVNVYDYEVPAERVRQISELTGKPIPGISGELVNRIPYAEYAVVMADAIRWNPHHGDKGSHFLFVDGHVDQITGDKYFDSQQRPRETATDTDAFGNFPHWSWGLGKNIKGR